MIASTQAAAELIASVRHAGGIIMTDGDVIDLAAPVPLPPDLVARIRQAKPAILAVLSSGGEISTVLDAARWRREFTIRTLDWLITPRTEQEATRLAWGQLQTRWHLSHGQRVPAEICAGCGQQIGIASALDLIDGTRVHFTGSYECLINFGRRWRGAATQALVAMELEPPVARGEL